MVLLDIRFGSHPKPMELLKCGQNYAQSESTASTLDAEVGITQAKKEHWPGMGLYILQHHMSLLAVKR